MGFQQTMGRWIPIYMLATWTAQMRRCNIGRQNVALAQAMPIGFRICWLACRACLTRRSGYMMPVLLTVYLGIKLRELPLQRVGPGLHQVTYLTALVRAMVSQREATKHARRPGAAFGRHTLRIEHARVNARSRGSRSSFVGDEAEGFAGRCHVRVPR